jgi:hypothetical protein
VTEWRLRISETVYQPLERRCRSCRGLGRDRTYLAIATLWSDGSGRAERGLKPGMQVQADALASRVRKNSVTAEQGVEPSWLTVS